MMLTGKVIFIISYENWGKMLMSKHHYAIQLGKTGNTVYFINHPDQRYELKRGQVKVFATDAENVFFVSHRLLHPYFFKFRYKKLYNYFTQFHIKKIIGKVGVHPDVVWSFDTSNTLPLEYFNRSSFKILMPVDGPFWHEDEIRSANKADVIISVTERILQPFASLKIPKYHINHGVADVFLKNNATYQKNNPLRIGYSGSLIRNDLDTKTFLTIISSHQDKIFEFWGEDDYKKSNMHLPQDVWKETLDFLKTLRQQVNVVMHGPVTSEKLASGIAQMDALLICYSIKDDQNHHKVLEYLGTGNVIISSYMSSYKDHNRCLIEMAKSKDNNDELPELFNTVISNLDHYNSFNMREERMAYAREHSYSNNIKKIEKFVTDNAIHRHD
jgi:hypothetical protein